VPATPGATPGQQSPAPTGTVPAQPGAASTEQASTHPGTVPAKQPSAQPGAAPTEQPSAQPGSAPTERPSAHPGAGQQASAHPGHAPAHQFSAEPKSSPAVSSLTPIKPTNTPTHTPAGSTSDAPAGQHPNQTTPNQTTFIPTTPARHNPVDKGLAAKPADKKNQVAIGDVYKGTNSGSTATRYPQLSTLNYQRARTTGGVALNVSVNANNGPLSTKENNGTAKGKTDINTTKNKKQSFLYGGLIVAPDLSTVKYQSIKGMGTTFGVLLGYQLNRKWAIETGAYYDHKKYYTDGEYFKKEPSIPPAYKLLNVDGSCNMWEIPLNVRYNLSSGEKTKWFATAGLSTYLMTNEKYVSTYTYNGSTWPKPWSNEKPSQYWFSIINLSVGYEQKLGRIGNLRLEPYLRIPLKGMGSGSLPIMSAGLNIGITRRIW
jgi:hypothetical protein